MSWLARSLANSLRLEDEDDEDDDVLPANNLDPTPPTSTTQREIQDQGQRDDDHHDDANETEPEEEAQSRGVKEDLTEFKQTLTRQLWGVASFLAPPPSHLSTPSHSQLDQLVSVRNQFEQSIQSDQWMSEEEEDASDLASVSNMDSSYVRSKVEDEYHYEDELEGVVGVTEEVLAFARNIAMHPETWLDFPVDEEEETDDFDLSDAQKEHAFIIERLAPRLAALRIELCPCHMSEGYFWKVYFVLLHSRLNKYDAEVLSTPQVVSARAMWMQELQKQSKQEHKWYGRGTSYLKDNSYVPQEGNSPMSYHSHSEDTLHNTFASEPSTSSMTTNYETEKHYIESTEVEFVDKSVIVEQPPIKTEDKNLATVDSSSKMLVQTYEDDSDDWPEDDSGSGGGYTGVIPLENEEDISFSDLENDDVIVPMKSKDRVK